MKIAEKCHFAQVSTSLRHFGRQVQNYLPCVSNPAVHEETLNKANMTPSMEMRIPIFSTLSLSVIHAITVITKPVNITNNAR